MLFIVFLFCIACNNNSVNKQNDETPVSDSDENEGEDTILTNDDDGFLGTLFGTPVLNPSGHAPLTAEIPFTPDEAGSMTLSITCPSIEDAEPLVRRFGFTTGGTLKIPILGLYAGCANQVSITLFDNKERERGTYVTTLQTAPLPEDFPLVTVTGTYGGDAVTFFPYYRAFKSEGSNDNNPEVLPGLRPEMTGIALDKKGRVRWYSTFPSPFFFPMEVIDGAIYGGAWYDDMGMLRWYDFMGYERGNIDIGSLGFVRVHHDVVKKPDGNLLITADKVGTDYIEDHVIEINPSEGSLVREWDLNTIFPDVADLFYDIPMTSTEYPGFSNDPIHLNSIFYDKEDDTLIVASQRSGVAKVTMKGTLVWFLAPHIERFIDDKNGDGISDSFVDGYDVNTQSTWVGDFKGPNYTEERYPIAGKPSEGYPFEFSYERFFLKPLDASGSLITDHDYLKGFTETPDFRYPFRPHAAQMRTDGTLMLFDNGLGRNFSIINPDFFSRAAIFRIEPGEGGYGGTVQQVGEYILLSDPLWYRFSVVVGDVDDLADGTLLVTSGALGTGLYPGIIMNIYGDGPRGAYLAQIDAATGEEVHSLLIERVVSDEYPNASFSVYRAERVDLYAVINLPPGLMALPLRE